MNLLELDAYVALAVKPRPADAGLEFLASMHLGQWTDVFAKALRLATTGLNGTPRVTMLANKPDFMQAKVIGDHGTYTSTIRRPSGDPASTKIEDWTCTCPWFDYAFDRTRSWKKLEGRICSHVLACFWKGRATPMDTAGQPPDFRHPPGQKQGPHPDQQGLFGPAGAPGADSATPEPEETPYSPDRDMPAQFLQQMPQVTDQENPQANQEPPSIFPTGPAAPNPWNPKQRPKGPLDSQTVLDLGTGVDYPGATPPPTQGYGMGVSIVDPSPPSPQRPIKFPGTLSNYLRTYLPPVYVVQASFVYGAGNDLEDWYNSMRTRKARAVAALVRPVMLEARGGKLPVPGAQPIGVTKDGLPRYRTLDLGWDPVTQRRMNADEMTRMDGGYASPGPGAPEQTGIYFEAPRNKRGEIVDTDPANRMAFVHVPLNDSGPLHPHLLAGWVDYADLRPIPDAITPFRVRVGPARPSK